MFLIVKKIDPDYIVEKKYALKNGFDISLVSYEKLTSGDVLQAVKQIKSSLKKVIGIYRGWMLEPDIYENLYQELLTKNIYLINSPKQYKHCHYLPFSYDKISSFTPKSKWSKEGEIINELLINSLTDEFGRTSIIVKDYVKSEKHNWKDACFIADASDKKNVNKIVSNFISLRGASFNIGLVFRKFEKLEFLTNHSKSSMPLTMEYRLVFINRQLCCLFNYWDEGEYDNVQPDLTIFKNVAKNIESNFFTMDIAKKDCGDWIIMELGDGQVAGFPDNADKNNFFSNLKEILL